MPTAKKTRKSKNPFIGRSFEEDLAPRMKDREFREHFMTRTLIGEAAVLVRAMREKAGFTQGELGRRAGMKQTAIARLESGKATTVPSLTTLAKIAAATGVKLRLGSENGSLKAQVILRPS